MPKQKKSSKLTAEEQAKRFREAAEKAGLTKDEKEFEGAFGRVVKPKTEPKNPRSD